jgi:hypothetical protein
MSQILSPKTRRFQQIKREEKQRAIRRAIEARIEEGLRNAGLEINPIVVDNLVRRELRNQQKAQ